MHRLFRIFRYCSHQVVSVASTTLTWAVALLLCNPIATSSADSTRSAEDLRIIHQHLEPPAASASPGAGQAPSQQGTANLVDLGLVGSSSSATHSLSHTQQARVDYSILISWSIPEAELAKIFAYAYQYQLPLLFQGFNAAGQEASIRDNQLRVANLIAKYQLRGIPQVWVDERRFKLLDQHKVPVLVQMAQVTQLAQRHRVEQLSQLKQLSQPTSLRLLYQQYGNISLEALASECRACVRRQELYQQLATLQVTGANSSSSLFPQPDITQVGTVANPTLAFRQQEGLAREVDGSDPSTSRSSSLSSSPSSLSLRSHSSGTTPTSVPASVINELNALLAQTTPARVLGNVYPITEQAFSELARSRLAQAQSEGKLNFTQVRNRTPIQLLEQTRALKTATLVRLRNQLENSLRELDTRVAALQARIEQLHTQGATSYSAWGRFYPVSALETQLDELREQQASLRQALTDIEQGNYPLLQTKHLHQVDFRPEVGWDIPPELLSAASSAPAPLLHALLIFVDLSNPQIQALLKDYFVEWHWLVDQSDSVVIVTDIAPPVQMGNAAQLNNAVNNANFVNTANLGSAGNAVNSGSSVYQGNLVNSESSVNQVNSINSGSSVNQGVSVSSRNSGNSVDFSSGNDSSLRSAFNYWLGSNKQVFLTNESLNQTFTPTAFTTVQQATTHDLTSTNLTMAQVLRGKLLVRNWSLADLEQWLRYIRQQREELLRRL